MMLLARFKRWCHLIKQFATLSIFRKEPCCAVTITEGWRTTHVRCTCGKEWK